MADETTMRDVETILADIRARCGRSGWIVGYQRRGEDGILRDEGIASFEGMMAELVTAVRLATFTEARKAVESARKHHGPRPKGTHGNCCTCQVCWEAHDDCVCRDFDLHNEGIDASLAALDVVCSTLTEKVPTQ